MKKGSSKDKWSTFYLEGEDYLQGFDEVDEYDNVYADEYDDDFPNEFVSGPREEGSYTKLQKLLAFVPAFIIIMIGFLLLPVLSELLF